MRTGLVSVSPSPLSENTPPPLLVGRLTVATGGHGGHARHATDNSPTSNDKQEQQASKRLQKIGR